MKQRLYTYTCAVIITAALLNTSCKKFVDVGNPPTSLTGKTVFNSDVTATAAMTSIYGRMMSSAAYFANGSIFSVPFVAGLSADEWTLAYPDPSLTEFAENAVKPNNFMLSFTMWNEAYQYIYTANQIIENVRDNENLSEDVRKRLEGEAKFIRAFYHFYLANLFGDVPLALTSDHNETAKLARTPKADVIEQVTSDLDSAMLLLPETYVDGRNQLTSERTRPNKFAAIALQARVQLYRQNWKDAEDLSTTIINHPEYQLAPLNDVFLKTSTEAIWQLQPVTDGFNTWEGYYYNQPLYPLYAVLGDGLLNAFENGDQRKVNWIVTDTTSTPFSYPVKYKVQFAQEKTEYSMVIRLAELYLIRAEARIQQDKMAQGLQDVNIIRERATDLTGPPANQLPQLPSTLSKNEAIDAVLNERRLELFTEWGHRWFDLKRTNKADNILSVAKPGWQSTDALYPLPQTELQRNSRLAQNEGY